jgi:hypothetical protein
VCLTLHVLIQHVDKKIKICIWNMEQLDDQKQVPIIVLILLGSSVNPSEEC